MNGRRGRRVLVRIAGLLAVGVASLVLLAGALAVAGWMTRFPPGAPPRGVLALTGGTVLAGPEVAPIADAVVVIEDGRIAAVGPANEVAIPVGAATLQLPGHTILPGLIDMHVHLGPSGTKPGETLSIGGWVGLIADALRYVPATRRALLAHGVTSVRSLGDDPAWVLELRGLVADGMLEGPRIFAAGPIFTTPGGHPVATFGLDPEGGTVRLPTSPQSARTVVRELAAGDMPVDLIKVVQERGTERLPLDPLPPDILRAIVEEAHANGLPVVAHWGTIADLAEVLAAGVDGVEHLEQRAVGDGWPPDALDALLAADIPLDPTLAVTAVSTAEDKHASLRAALATYMERGGSIVAGSDSGMPGISFGAGLHRELALLVRSGVPPAVALRAATADAARALGDRNIGVIAPGRAADLLVVAGRPDRDIAAIGNVRHVFRDGRRVAATGTAMTDGRAE